MNSEKASRVKKRCSNNKRQLGCVTTESNSSTEIDTARSVKDKRKDFIFPITRGKV